MGALGSEEENGGRANDQGAESGKKGEKGGRERVREVQ